MRLLLTIILIAIGFSGFSQDLPYTRKMLDTLTSPSLWGRGYTKGGMDKAANLIAEQFRKQGLTPLDGKDYKQSFALPVNTFPGKMLVAINERKLVPGIDFIVSPGSKGLKASGTLNQKDSSVYVDQANRLVVELKDKLTWSVSQQVDDFTLIQIDRSKFNETPKSIAVDIENEFVPAFKAYNVGALIKGTVKPDSVIVITAHYDHLGGMGDETYFPGANDNASGVSLLLSLSKHYAINPPPYTVAFICFAAEEAGIIGSKYFTEHPLLDLAGIRFLINLDLVGTGVTGATVVNATVHQNEFAMLTKINDQHKYLAKINARGKAANSDHYFFSEKGVPAFFIYTQGGIAAYHDVYDKASTLPFSEYNDLFKLLDAFSRQLMK